MTDMIINFLIGVFEIYMIYDFFHDILEKRFEGKLKTVVLLGLLAILLYGVNYFKISQINLFGALLIYLLETFIFFYGNLKTRISYFLICYIIILGMEFAAGILFMVLSNSDFLTEEKNPFNNFFLIITTKLLTYVILRLIKLFIKRKEMSMRGRFLKMAFLLPITTVFLYAGLFYGNIQMEHGKIILSAGCLLLLASNVLLFFIIEKLTYVMQENSEYDLMKLQNAMNSAYYEKLEEMGLLHKKYAHDLKEYLQTIGGLAAQSKNEEIINVLKDMEVEIDSIPDKIYTSNSVLNALLCEKELQAQNRDIEINITVEPKLPLDRVKSGDLIVMIGNLLDNAIESAALCEKKRKIDLRFFEPEGNFIVLNIENTYGNEIKKKGETFLSTKRGENHQGIGIKSVQETALKYGGLLFLKQEEDVFVTILTIAK